MTIWQLIQARAEKNRAAKAEKEKQAHPIDLELPLSLRINGKVEISPLLPAQGLNAEFPIGASIVQGFSKATVNGQTCFRVLLSPEKDGTPSYLWITQDEKGAAVRWFVKLDEVRPTEKDDWDFWLSDEDGSIGLSAFQSKTSDLYNRLWVPESPARIEPVNYEETLFLDRFDSSAQQIVQHKSMLYGRQVKDPVCPCDELILLSATTEAGESYVSIDAGVDLSAVTDIKVVY